MRGSYERAFIPYHLGVSSNSAYCPGIAGSSAPSCPLLFMGGRTRQHVCSGCPPLLMIDQALSIAGGSIITCLVSIAAIWRTWIGPLWVKYEEVEQWRCHVVRDIAELSKDRKRNVEWAEREFARHSADLNKILGSLDKLESKMAEVSVNLAELRVRLNT